MKTNSLRIGNYVLCAGKVIAVTSVFPKGINAHTDRITGKVSYIPADRIDPIPLPPACSSGSGCAVMLCVGSNTASITFMSTEPWISFTYPSAGLASGYVRCGSFISFKISSRMGGELSLIRGNNLPLKAFDVKFFMDTFRKNKL